MYYIRFRMELRNRETETTIEIREKDYALGDFSLKILKQIFTNTWFRLTQVNFKMDKE